MQVLFVPVRIEGGDAVTQVVVADGVRQDVEEATELIGREDHAPFGLDGGLQPLLVLELGYVLRHACELPVHQGVDQGRHQTGLVAEVVTDGGFIDPRLGGHVRTNGVVATLAKQLASGREDLLGRLWQRGSGSSIGKGRMAAADAFPACARSAGR